MSIPLPPRPESAVKLHGKRGKQLSPEAMSFYTEEALRARDQEIVRCVLEAAANECRAIELAAWREYKIGRKTSAHTEGRSDGAGECAAVIKALEFHHE